MTQEKTLNSRVLLLVILSLLLNIVMARLVHTFEIPLFLDSTGTILAAALGGCLPGIIVGFFTNYIISMWDDITIYYTISSVMIAAAAFWLARFGAFRSLRKAILAILVFAFIGGVIGSVMTWCIFGFNIGSGISAPYSAIINSSTLFGKFLSQLFADFSIDLADKAITVLLVWTIIRLLPSSFIGAMPCDCSEPAEDHAAEGRTYRRRSISTKITMLVVGTSAILSLLALSISWHMYSKTMDRRYLAQCEASARLAASEVPGDVLSILVREGPDSPVYKRYEGRLHRIRRDMRDITALYICMMDKSGCRIIYDLEPREREAVFFGGNVRFGGDFVKYLEDFNGGRSIEPAITEGREGRVISSFIPITNLNGKCVGWAGAEISMRSIMSDRYMFITRMFALLFAASILILSFALWFAQRKLVEPLNALASAANRFAFEDESERLGNRNAIKKVKIKTGDEIEYLHEAISKTISDIFDYIDLIAEKSRDLEEKANVISEMQDNIIISFANMVENRDMNTGSHVRRTAAYVGAICGELSCDPQYAGSITPDYRRTLEKSAPLHDIGKIKIPDAILNKPGRLTPEEFDVIKGHTTAGRDILKSALIGRQEDGYLSEAQKMVYCHHERWDGKGYPCGISGSDIPLCARVMALADVFDALISRRSYKPPMDFDAAVEIIKAESGTHFDPSVVAAFLRITDKIRQIAEDNRDEEDGAKN